MNGVVEDVFDLNGVCFLTIIFVLLLNGICLCVPSIFVLSF